MRTQQQTYYLGRHAYYSDYVRAELRSLGRIYGKRTLRAALRKADSWRDWKTSAGYPVSLRPALRAHCLGVWVHIRASIERDIRDGKT